MATGDHYPPPACPHCGACQHCGNAQPSCWRFATTGSEAVMDALQGIGEKADESTERVVKPTAYDFVERLLRRLGLTLWTSKP